MSDLPALPKFTDEEKAEIARLERVEIARSVDAITRARGGSLAAHGCSDQAIVDMLLLSMEQVLAIKDTEEFKSKYADIANDIIQRQVDANEGWDVVEQKAIMQIMQTLEFNRDPKYALFAATAANKAVRRKPEQRPMPRVIAVPTVEDDDKANAPVVTNVINLTINRNYLTMKTSGDAGAVLDVTAKHVPEQRRISDLPSPKSVDDLLAPVRSQKQKVMSEVEKAFEMAGVVFDSEDGQ